MKSIKIVGKAFKLGSRFARLFAFLIDGMLVASMLSIAVLILYALGAVFSFIGIGLLSALLWIFGPAKINVRALVLLQIAIVALFGSLAHQGPDTLLPAGGAIGTAILFLIDGFKNGQGPGKKLMSLQVRRLKDGKPCTLKDSLIRRFTAVFQPLDSFWIFGKHWSLQ